MFCADVLSLSLFQLIMEIMEIITPFKSFYNTIQSIKDNDEQYPHILSRLEALQQVASNVQEKEPEKMSEDVRKGLEKLSTILASTKNFSSDSTTRLRCFKR